jgi:heme/copper-type cytochrome/quinol oxidase subunit 1
MSRVVIWLCFLGFFLLIFYVHFFGINYMKRGNQIKICNIFLVKYLIG